MFKGVINDDVGIVVKPVGCFFDHGGCVLIDPVTLVYFRPRVINAGCIDGII